MIWRFYSITSPRNWPDTGPGRKQAWQAALEGGSLLNEAKDRLNHGDFGPFVDRTGLERRTARNWMMLAGAGFTTAAIEDFGGIRASLEALRTEKTETVSVLAGYRRLADMEIETGKILAEIAELDAQATPKQRERFARFQELQGENRELRQTNWELTYRAAQAEREADSLRREVAALGV